MKYHLVQLGCQMNQADGERIAAVLQAIGYQKTDNEDEANLLGVVACSVRQKAIDKVYNMIAKWNRMKAQRNLITFVSGCVLDEDKLHFLDRFDLVFGISELPGLPDMIAQYGVATPVSLDPNHRKHAEEAAKYQNTVAAVKEMQQQLRLSGGSRAVLTQVMQPTREVDPLGGFWNIRPEYHSRFEAFVPIQNGCDKFCTFCAVPYTRGREVSRPASEVLAEIQDLVTRGYRSITLLGQNVNSYGLDRLSREGKGIALNFTGLLRVIGEYGDSVFKRDGTRFWVYFTSPHPRDMDESVLRTIARYGCLAKQIHLPLQSGDDHVLMRMNRKHTMDRYRSVVADIRRILPSATLFTDIIVGFSGETDEQFGSTRAAMLEIPYNMAYVAMYSPRPGAVSSRWEDDVSLDTKKQRLQELSEILHVSGRAWNARYLGQNLTALVEGIDHKNGFINARTEGKIQVRFLPPESGSGPESLPETAEAWLGRFVQVRIDSFKAMSMQGSFVGFGFPDGSGNASD